MNYHLDLLPVYHHLTIRLCFLAILTLMLSCNNMEDQNQVPAVQQNRQAEAEAEAIKNTLVEMWDAIEQEDIERYQTYIHPDFTQFGETDSTISIGKKNEIEGVKNWIADSDNIHTEMHEPKVTIKGNVGWITYYWSDSGTTNGEPFSSRGKSTRIFVKENGKWLCIHGHYTLLPAS